MASEVEVTPDTTTIELPPPDPCEPNPCGAPPSEVGCSLDRTARTAAASGPGRCVVDAGEAHCDYAEDETECALEALCTLGECEHVGTFCDFPLDAGPWTFGVAHVYGGMSTEADPDTGAPVDECCFDLDGDGVIDNGFGTMMRAIGTFFPVDLNEWLNGRIKTFAAVFVSQLRGVPEPAADLVLGRRTVDLLGFSGSPAFESTGHFEGHGQIEVSEHSFAPGTVIPRVHVQLELDDGAIVGGYGVMGFASGEQLRQADVTVVRAEGELALGPDGFGFATSGTGNDGDQGVRFGGYIARTEWLSLWNDYIAEFCTCTTFPDSVDGLVIDTATGLCQEALSTCTEPDSICRVFTSAICQGLVDMMAADLDTDSDGKADAISAGWWSKSVPVTVSKKIRTCD